MNAALLLLLALSQAHATDCVNFFYGKSERDDETWYYGAGRGPDITTARERAVGSLSRVAGIKVVDYEQDAYAVCDETHYMLVRAERYLVDKAKGAKTDAERISDMGRKVDVFSRRRAVDEARIASQEQDIAALKAAPAGPMVVYDTGSGREVYAPSRAQQEIYGRELEPRIRASLAKVESGRYGTEDVATIIAGLNTTGDIPALARFCRKILAEDLSDRAGLRTWVAGQCAKAR